VTADREAELSLTRERAARVEAERQGRLKDQFIAMLAHELRTPMTTLLLWEKVLHDEDAGPKLRAQALEAIRHSAIAQSRMVGNLLDLSRAISGTLRCDRRTVEVGDVLASALAHATPELEARQLVLDHEAIATPLLIEGDELRVRQLFDLLLANAIECSDQGGRITIRCQRTRRTVAVSIADTGRGIRPALLATLFERYQHEPGIDGAREGLNLGLAVAHQLALLHKGALEAASPGLGHGATFTVTLPRSRARQATSPPLGLPHTRSVRPLATYRILMIDDDARVREALGHLLRSAGAEVWLAQSAEHGRQQLATASVDVILCDVAMPGIDGFTFIRALRASGSRIPAIALTAHASAEHAECAHVAGFDVHLAKPIHLDRLVATIVELIRSRRERDFGSNT
jgi:CheY-like chemotaxis protein